MSFYTHFQRMSLQNRLKSCCAPLKTMAPRCSETLFEADVVAAVLVRLVPEPGRHRSQNVARRLVHTAHGQVQIGGHLEIESRFAIILCIFTLILIS